MTTEKEIELKPCPFCTSSDVVVCTRKAGKYGSIYCLSCRCFGPRAESKTNAIKAWNTRHMTPAEFIEKPKMSTKTREEND